MFNQPFPVAEVDERSLFDLSCSRIIGPVITLAQEINLFKLIDEAPQTIEDAAKHLKITPIISEAFMAVLAAFGLLASRLGPCDSEPYATRLPNNHTDGVGFRSSTQPTILLSRSSPGP